MTDLIGRTLHRLGQKLHGRLSTPGDEAYTAATAIWAKPVGRVPRAVVHCRTVEDVKLAVRAARDCGLPLSVRGGGHDWVGRALCDGIVIDLSGMNSVVRFDDTVQISGGARAADVVAVSDRLGLVAVTGSVGSVGMAGLTLGGGYGPLIGRFGLALDNLVGAEMVLSDGRVVVADAESEEELFWAIRGGGGNFGVVTTMRHRLHGLSSVHSGMLGYPFAEAKAVIERCADIAASAPDGLTAQLGAVAGPDGAPVVLVVPTWCGAANEGETRLAPFLKLGTLLAGGINEMPYGTSLKVFDPYLVNGQRVLMETCWIPTLDSGCADVFVRAMETAASAGCAIFTHEFRGAAARVPTDATAFALRRDHVLIEILATFVDRSDPEEELRHRHWVNATLQAFDATSLPGGYPNLLADGDTARAARSYGGNAIRLMKAKRRYDPENVFRSAIPLPASADFDERPAMRRGEMAGAAR